MEQLQQDSGSYKDEHDVIHGSVTPQIDSLADLAGTPEARERIAKRTEVLHRIAKDRNAKRELQYVKVVIGRRIMQGFTDLKEHRTSENTDDVL